MSLQMALRLLFLVALLLPSCGTRSALSDDPHGPSPDGDADADADGDGDADVAPSCSDICHRLIVCGISGDDFATVEECLDRCGEVQRAWSPEAFQLVFGECIPLGCFEIEDCYDDQVLEVPPQGQHLELCDRFCARFEDCGEAETDCVDRCLGNEEEAITLFSSEVVDSLLQCLDSDCGRIEECVDDVLASYGLL